MAKVDQRLFDSVKLLKDNGLSNLDAARCVGISDTTVKLINSVETYEDYRELILEKSAEIRERNAVKKANQEPQVQVVEHRQSVTIQATEYMMRELKQTNEYLRIISNKLAAIIDDLYGTEGKK